MQVMPCRKEEKGSVLIGALILLAAVLSFSYLVPSFTGLNEKQLKVSRVRSAMATIESRVRGTMMHPSSYINCSYSWGTPKCDISQTVLERYRITRIPGTACNTPKSGCGIVLEGPIGLSTVDLENRSRTFEFNLKYTGKDMSIKDTSLAITVPFELLQPSNQDCGLLNPEKPIFKGFDNKGQIKCAALPQKSCDPGQFLSSIGSRSLNLECKDIPKSNVECGSNEYIAGIQWTAENRFVVQCAPRANPYAFFGDPTNFSSGSLPPTTTTTVRPLSILCTPKATPPGGDCTNGVANSLYYDCAYSDGRSQIILIGDEKKLPVWPQYVDLPLCTESSGVYNCWRPSNPKFFYNTTDPGPGAAVQVFSYCTGD